MISGGIEINYFAQIILLLGAKFDNDSVAQDVNRQQAR